MKDPDLLWKDIVYRFAQQSRCKSRQVGCIIVSADNRLIGQGFNGAPAGNSCDYCLRCKNGKPESGKDLENAICAHAEANAIGYAANAGISTSGCTLYCTTEPCIECVKLIIAAGISHVVCYEAYPSWGFVSAKEMLYKANVKLTYRNNGVQL